MQRARRLERWVSAWSIGAILPVGEYGLFAGGMPATEAFRPLSWSDQGMVVFTAFVAKPLYVATSLWLAWRRRGMRAADLAAAGVGGTFFIRPLRGPLSDNRQTTICAPRLT